ncbi:hypothetical protein GPECTOR_4g679 [Gonium pectorale]|uniref:Uncharacterized protein n=1 Tax=Gonium pectorale TaxID=33097 RepID=A0A150GXU9_GONPE|nr:hypothetical protein GPECTOR_4g679 [Gonium pectorale]|eukprot:KXZ54614.1 hypothetical protein GPECTOR_4g679 [Gonium pectorale]
MAGKVAGGEAPTAGPSADSGRSRAAAGDGAAGSRASKLSAAAPTFEPTPAAPAKEQVPVVPSVPAAFGAPLQPLTSVPAMQPAAPVSTVPEAYGAPLQPLQPHAQYMPIQHQQMQHALPPQQQMQPPQQMMQPPSPQAPQVPAYGAPPMQQGVQQPSVMGNAQPMAPPQQQQYSAQGMPPGGSYGSYNDMETWFQDAYQKALATGMDPQQAYSAVQGYVQGMQMAFQTLAAAQQRGAYPGMPPQGQVMPQGQ